MTPLAVAKLGAGTSPSARIRPFAYEAPNFSSLMAS